MSQAQAFLNKQEENQAFLRNADRLWHLQQTGLTDGLALREMHALADACTDVIVKKDQAIYHQGDAADALFLVNRGAVRLSVAGTEGRQKIVAVLGTGDCFGEEAVGAESIRSSAAIAHQESWISIIARQTLLRMMRETIQLSFNILDLLNGRLAEAHQELENLSFSTTKERIARTLLKLAEEHGKNIVTREGVRKLKIKMSHELLSQMIGANRPHVSAIMSEFKKNGWIQYQKRKLLVHEEKLSRVARGTGFE